MIYAAIIAICMTSEKESCSVRIFPQLFDKEQLCMEVLTNGLNQGADRIKPHSITGRCVSFPYGTKI